MSTPTITLHGRKVVGGSAEGEALVTHQTISGWGESIRLRARSSKRGMSCAA